LLSVEILWRSKLMKVSESSSQWLRCFWLEVGSCWRGLLHRGGDHNQKRKEESIQ
jgi:hypothetical protein